MTAPARGSHLVFATPLAKIPGQHPTTPPENMSQVKELTDAEFADTVANADVPVLVDFYADWCAPCKMVAPLIDEIAYQKIGKMLVVKVDTDHAPDIAMRYEIRSIPTLVIFEGGEEVERSLGFEPERVRGLAEQVVA